MYRPDRRTPEQITFQARCRAKAIGGTRPIYDTMSEGQKDRESARAYTEGLDRLAEENRQAAIRQEVLAASLRASLFNREG